MVNNYFLNTFSKKYNNNIKTKILLEFQIKFNMIKDMNKNALIGLALGEALM